MHDDGERAKQLFPPNKSVGLALNYPFSAATWLWIQIDQKRLFIGHHLTLDPDQS